MNFFGKIFSSEKTEKLEMMKPKHGRKGTQDDLDMEKIGLGKGKKGATLRTPRIEKNVLFFGTNNSPIARPPRLNQSLNKSNLSIGRDGDDSGNFGNAFEVPRTVNENEKNIRLRWEENQFGEQINSIFEKKLMILKEKNTTSKLFNDNDIYLYQAGKEVEIIKETVDYLKKFQSELEVRKESFKEGKITLPDSEVKKLLHGEIKNEKELNAKINNKLIQLYENQRMQDSRLQEFEHQTEFDEKSKKEMEIKISEQFELIEHLTYKLKASERENYELKRMRNHEELRVLKVIISSFMIFRKTVI
jgi:hypothetical protein